jgi:hypothetical protein
MVHLYPVLEALHHQRHGVVSIQSKSMGTGSSFEGVSSQKFARYLCLSMSGSHPWLSTSDTGLKLGEEPLRKDCQYEREISYANHLGLMLQPTSFADFQAYPDFVEAFRLWTQKTTFEASISRVWSLVLTGKQVLSKHGGSLPAFAAGVVGGVSFVAWSWARHGFANITYLKFILFFLYTVTRIPQT